MAKEIKIRIDSDETELILDLPNFALEAPETGIYDEPVRWYKANLKWAKIIEGFVGHLLTYHAWKNAENELFIGVQEIATWLEGVEAPTPEFPTEGDCFEYPLSAPFIDYEPQDPFNEPDYIPPPYLMPTFMLNDELEYPEILGYQATDVFVPFGAVNIDPIDLATMNLPRLILSVKGSGQIELDLLAVAFGGIAVIKVGSMPNIADIVLDNVYDTGIQVIDLEIPTGTIAHAGNVKRGTEINVEAAEGVTTLVYIVFSPKVNDSIIPIAFGGGVRTIQLCGFEQEGQIMGLEDIRFNPETCAFEKRIDGVWLVIDGNDSIDECLGGDMATQEEITEAVVDAAEIISSRFLAGVAGNVQGSVTINPDGSQTIGGEGNLPDDDPTTEINETDAAYYGGVFDIAAKLELVSDKVEGLYGGTNGSPATILATAQFIMRTYFSCDKDLMDAAVAAYYTYRNSNGYIDFNRTTALPLYMFCNGYTLEALARYLQDISGIIVSKQEQLLNLWGALSDDFFSHYFETGSQVPSTGYLSAACVPMPPQAFTDVPYNSVRNLSPAIAKGGHRLQIKVSGHYVDGAEIQDAFWYRSAAGVLTRSNFTFSHAAGSNMPTDDQVPYNPTTHTYVYTVDLATGTSSWSITFNRNANMDVASTSPTGGFDIEIVDLGLAVSQ
jgi:hypothetical protein